LSERGLTANDEKCIFNSSSITFFGLELSADGVSLNKQKTKALKHFKVPSNASELHSFLGLSVYASRWIPNLANVSEPLWKLTHKEVRWQWNEEHH
jgi:hypothetical protein